VIGLDAVLNVVWTIVKTVLMLGVMIFFHELGHFITAKLSGIKVNEFALGMGPKIFGKKKGDTQYSLRLLPVGGFVAMEGEDAESDDENSYMKKPKWKRAIVLVAGATMNIILGLIILGGLTCSSELIGTRVIAGFKEGATSNAVLQQNDEIKKINGHRVGIDNDIVFELVRDEDGMVDFTVVHDGETIELKEVPFQMTTAEDGTRAITLDFSVYGEEKSFFGVVKHAFAWTGSVIKTVWVSLVELITGKYSISELSGPVGVATAVSQASSYGWDSLFLLVAYITINLGVFNLLPFPALDGGKLALLVVELIRGKPLDPKYEGYINLAGLAVLFGLMIVVTVSDVIKLF